MLCKNTGFQNVLQALAAFITLHPCRQTWVKHVPKAVAFSATSGELLHIAYNLQFLMFYIAYSPRCDHTKGLGVEGPA